VPASARRAIRTSAQPLWIVRRPVVSA
jgi:hypothetical protein